MPPAGLRVWMLARRTCRTSRLSFIGVWRTVVPAWLRQTDREHRLRRALARHLRVDVLVGNADEHKPKRGPRDIPRSEDNLRQRSKAWQGACRQRPQVSERGSSGTVERRWK